MNKQPFYVGQKVVCVDPIGCYIKEVSYTVKEIICCKKCGLVQIGCTQHFHKNPIHICHNCDTQSTGGAYYMANATRFAPYNPPRHENVEVCEIEYSSPEEMLDVVPETINQ